MSLERRQFIQGLGLSAAALSLPGWMQACSPPRVDKKAPAAKPSDGPPTSAHEALERARGLGRPLLVIVVPDDLSLRGERSSLWGSYLNHVDDEGIVDLALCEVWCARPTEIHDEIAPRLVVGADVQAVLVESDGRPPQLVRVPLPRGSPFPTDSYENAVRERIGRLRDGLRAVIAPDSLTLDRRVEENRRSLAEELLLDDHTIPSQELAVRAPAWVRWRAGHGTAMERAEWTRLLHEQVAARLQRAPPPPARWARSGGCGGLMIEGEPNHRPGVACGMAMVPAISSRFLVFYLDKG